MQAERARSKKLAVAAPTGVEWDNENKNTTQPHRGGERSPQQRGVWTIASNNGKGDCGNEQPDRVAKWRGQLDDQPHIEHHGDERQSHGRIDGDNPVRFPGRTEEGSPFSRHANSRGIVN
jgi:hypothetical protein